MKKTIVSLLLFCLFAAALSGALLFLLPVIADRYVLPKIAAGLPFSEKHLSIARITPWSLHGVILLQDREEGGVAVPRFELRYSPRGLLRGKVDTLFIDSASLYLEQSDGSLAVQGMQTGSAQTANGGKELQQPVLPLAVEHIELQRCRIVYLAEGGARHHFSLEASLHPDYEDAAKRGSRVLSLQGRLALDGAAALSAHFETEPTAEGHNVSVTAVMENIGEARPFFNLAEEAELAGKLDLRAELVTEGIMTLSAYELTASLDSFSFNGRGISAETTQKPALVKVDGTAGRLHYLVENLEIVGPEAFAVELEGEYDFQQRHLEGTAELLSGRTGSAISLSYQGKLGDVVAVDYTLEAEAFTLVEDMEFAAFSATGAFEIAEGTIAAHIRGTIPSIKDTSRDLELTGITLELPFNKPKLATGVVIPGNVFIDRIRYKNTDAGRLNGSVSIAADGFSFSSQMTSPLLEDMRLTCSGETDYRRNAEINCHQPAMRLISEDLKKLVSLPEKLDFETTLAAELRLLYRNGVVSGTAQCTYENGRVAFDNHVFSEISGKVKFPALPVLRSAPSQPLRIGNIQLGALSMSDARIDLRLDDAATIFIEQAKINWCGGRVETAALQLHQGMESLDTTLYCDRLGFTQLLDQLGIGAAEGEGSLNGKLPIRLSRKGVKFDNGFLFSTPGKSGIVNFSDTEQFRRGIAAAERSIYLEYSLAALRNFSYDWTKLTFDTEGKELLLSLELDGKPAQPLPFGYENGRIVKKAEGGGIQHPIRLDVNFRLPVEELFRYGKGIQSLMENM